MSPTTILFADNNLRFIKVRKEFLEEKGYRVAVATSPSEAKKMIDHQQPDLAVIDIRLLDDDDEHDVSGIVLARELNSDVPKIILTGFPTWQLVKEALGPQVDGLPLAVEFISKKEGPEALLSAIEWQLHYADFRTNILHTFNVPNLMALPPHLECLSPEETSSRLYKSFEDTSEQLSQYRDLEHRRASQYHAWGLRMAIAGMGLILVSVTFTLFGQLAPLNLSLISAAISEAASVLYFYQQNQAHKRVSFYIEQLGELNKLGNLIAVCDSLVSLADREAYKKKIIGKLLNNWFGK
jgi:CheY-like chemotaxis protein